MDDGHDGGQNLGVVLGHHVQDDVGGALGHLEGLGRRGVRWAVGGDQRVGWVVG